jgi:hypothetical protein
MVVVGAMVAGCERGGDTAAPLTRSEISTFRRLALVEARRAGERTPRRFVAIRGRRSSVLRRLRVDAVPSSDAEVVGVALAGRFVLPVRKTVLRGTRLVLLFDVRTYRRIGIWLD